MPRSSLLNVPYTGVPEVESRDRPQAWQNIKVNEDAFGASKGRALQQLGQAIGTIGGQIGAQQDKNQAELDGIKAREIDTEVMKQYTQETAAYTLQNGEQAVNSSADHEKRLLEIKENAIKNAGGNKSVERMVRSSVEGQYRRAWSTAFGHKTKETIRYGDEVSEARITAAQQRAQTTMDEKELESSINIIAGETNEKKRRNSWSPEVTDLEIKNRTSTAYTGFIGNMARHYPARAQEYYNKYKDSMNPAGQDAANKAITDGFAGIGANEPGTQAVQGTEPQLPRRRPIPPMPPPPSAPVVPGRPGGQRSEVEPEVKGVQLASLTTSDTMSDAPQPGAIRLADASAKPFSPGWTAPGYVAPRQEVESYIIQQSRLRGIDPGTALEVYHNEGLGAWKSLVPGENSFGPFQLYTGGGLGNKFIEAGHGDPSDPKTWKKNIDFALNNVVEGGWGPWNGAKKVGITGKMGVANNARVIPVGTSGPSLVTSDAPVAGKDEDGDEPEPKTPLEGRTIGGFKKVISEGDPNAKAAPGSRVIEAQNIPGRIRALPVAPQLKSSFETAANAAGVVIRITSGGQTHDRDPAKKDVPGGWTGSLRHGGGNAADVDVLGDDGKKLARNDPRRLKFLEEVAATGAGGIGSGYMGDPLKVHIGLTGNSGQVGVGLGVYSKESTPEEVAAVKRGLARLEANGGPVAGPSVTGSGTRGGNVRYASLGPSVTGTMTDASPELPSAATRYAQATTVVTDAKSPFNGPVTADTTEANIRARMKWIEDDARANGHDPSFARSVNAKLVSDWEAMKSAKKETHALAFKAVEEAVYGKDGNGKTKTREEILSDPAMKTQWDLLTNKEKDAMEKQLIARNSEGENRPVSPSDLQRLDALRAAASTNPEVLRDLDLGEWPRGLRPTVMKLRNDLYTNGVGGNAETKEINRVMEDKAVAFQLSRIGITEESDPTVYGDIKAKMAAEIRLWKETNDKPMNSEQAAAKMNMLLRTEVVPGRFWGTNERRAFERPLTTAQEKQIVSDWNKRFPDNQVKTHEDIPPSNRWYWMRKKEEAEKRRLQGGQ